MKDDRLYLINIRECIDLRQVWGIVECDLPDLKPEIDAMLRELGYGG